MVAKAAAKLAEKGTKYLTMKQMRSYGTRKKISPNQVKIGDTKSGLYYDKNLPFLNKILYPFTVLLDIS